MSFRPEQSCGLIMVLYLQVMSLFVQVVLTATKIVKASSLVS